MRFAGVGFAEPGRPTGVSCAIVRSQFGLHVAVNRFQLADGDGLPARWEGDNALDFNNDGSVNPDNGADGDSGEDVFTNTK